MLSRWNGPGRVSSDEFEAALAAYAEAFPDTRADWLHPSLVGTKRLNEALQQAVRRGRPLSRDEIEAEFGPLEW